MKLLSRIILLLFLTLEVFAAIPAALSPAPGSPPQEFTDLRFWCEGLKKETQKLHWSLNPCDGIQWKVGGRSVEGRPLVYAEFGDPNARNTTLIFSMVHPDEITPLYLGLKLSSWLKQNISSSSSTRVVLAPLVTPDSFFKNPRLRVNARGVDVNRNFATEDWQQQALSAWKTKYRSNPRRFPGLKPNSEPETLFQVELIEKVRPQKILSIHAPLNVMDFDGPSVLHLSRFNEDYVVECMRLRSRLRAKSTGFFPGSLGNFAGRELGIPTVTLELPSADPRKAEAYWKKFSTGIRTMIDYQMPDLAQATLR